METIVIDEDAKAEWEEYLEENPYAIAWQSYNWSAVVRKHYSVEFYPIAAFENSKICGILPVYKVKGLFGKEALISVPYAVAGGIVSDSEEATSHLLQKAIDLGHQFNCTNITLKQYKVKINSNLRTDDSFYNRELGLTDNIDELWHNISDINRERIDQSEKYPIILDYPSNDLDVFYKLLLKHQHNMGIPCVSKKWIQDLVAFGMYSIALLRDKTVPLAGTLVKKFKKTISFPFTCIPEESEKSKLFAYRLYWELLQRFAADRMEIFHSGRIPKSNLTDEYRLGWGGTKHGYYYQYYPSSVDKTEFSKRRGKKREFFTATWKKLPLGIARPLGPYIVRRFP